MVSSSSSGTNSVFLWVVGRGSGALMQLELLVGKVWGRGRGNGSYCDTQLSRGGRQCCGFTVHIIDNSNKNNDNMLVSCFSQLLQN